MSNRLFDFVRISAVLGAVLGVSAVGAAQAPNPRSMVSGDVSSQRNDASRSSRVDSGRSAVVSSRGVTSARSAANTSRAATNVRSAATNTVRSSTVARSGANTSRAATVARSAATNTVRSGVKPMADGVARAASRSRATAVFNDISKIGGGYATCREAYATCMDQFCANANDTYRRCYCSDRFIDFRDTELALDEAKELLLRFQDNNLNAVDKTAAEVSAMYSATVGEAAIKNDTSAAQNILNEIGDLLSGKKKASNSSSSDSLGVLSLDFTSDIGDIWGGGGGGSIFDTATGVDMSSLEGQSLFTASDKQCVQIISDQCDSQAVLNMATSAYGIMISQDCNAYEKSVNAKRESVAQTVRQAERILRDARLEEYRSHNSADVNACITQVRSAITNDVACGANYKRCLDYSGAYINQTTGEPIYSPRLFELEKIISLKGAGDFDLLGQNQTFDKFLDTKRVFAANALDSCRDIADTVWREFKRTALIEIAQAQDEKLEEVKMSCVGTMKECYDTQTNALKEFDTTTAQATGALSAYAARAMCADKVTACAALYSSGGAGCEFDDNGHLTTEPNKCGLAALISFVDTVDDTRVAEGCASSIDAYVQDLCTPTAGDMGFPWNCRNIKVSSNVSSSAKEVVTDTTSIEGLIKGYAFDRCGDPTRVDNDNYGYNNLDALVKTQIEEAITDIREQLTYQLSETCETLGGYWIDGSDATNPYGDKELDAFYNTVFPRSTTEDVKYNLGKCFESSTRTKCLAYNTSDQEPMATYNAATNECTFTDAWYQQQCVDVLGGLYQGGICYVAVADEQ